jgi:hypothetical protein
MVPKPRFHGLSPLKSGKIAGSNNLLQQGARWGDSPL